MRVTESRKGDLGLGLVCLSVADQGDGIAATLPAKGGETTTQRFIRAFLPGESRKPNSVVLRGLGLPKLVSAAHHLQALIRVNSGGLAVMQDFSLGENKYPKLDFGAVREFPHAQSAGTCVSIFFPEFAINLDQTQLFGR